MSDLIKRSDAIDAINEYGSVWMEYTDAMTIDEIAERALKASKQSMVKILHDLPSAQPEVIACGEGELKSAWIPCSERLPEAGKQYLCCDENGFREVGYLSKTTGNWGFLDSEALGEVMAWMPLPEPYKEVEE